MEQNQSAAPITEEDKRLFGEMLQATLNEPKTAVKVAIEDPGQALDRGIWDAHNGVEAKSCPFTESSFRQMWMRGRQAYGQYKDLCDDARLSDEMRAVLLRILMRRPARPDLRPRASRSMRGRR